MRTLHSGSVGPAVRFLQLALNRAGFGALDRDGVFGAATRAAVLRFQKTRGLNADGIVGSATHRALMPFYLGYTVHTVTAGDTLWSISRRYGSSLAAVSAANPTVNAENLRIGSRLTVPLPFDVVPTDTDWFSELTGFCVRGLAARFPFLSTGSIGRSVMGRPIWRLSMGRGENRVLYNASHHANEWITTPLLLKFAEELCKAYIRDGSIFDRSAAEILDYASLTLIPAVNPDGIDLVTGELSQGAYYDRALAIAAKYPQFPFPSGWKANIRGVDLNLQYPAGWEQAKEIKYAQGISSPAPADFVGSAPLSAPESRAVFDYTLSFDPALVLAFHTQGNVIYWRYLDYDPPNSRAIAELFSSYSGYAAENTPYASGFAGYKDWFILNYDRPGYTVEAGSGVNPLPISQFDEIYSRCLGILTYGALVT